MNSSKRSVLTLQEAVDSAPTLGALAAQARAGSVRLAAVRGVLPAGLGALVRSGANDDSGWCLLVPHAAAAAKLRQLVPQLLSALDTQGLGVAAIRVKVARTSE